MPVTKQSDVEKVVQDINKTFDGRGPKNIYPSCEERNFKSSDENHLKTCFDCEYVSDNARAPALKSNIDKDGTKLEVGDKLSPKSERGNYRFYCDVCSFGAAKSQNYRQHMKTKRHLENAEQGTNMSDDNSGLKSKTEEVENLKTKTHLENSDQEINIKVNVASVGAPNKSDDNDALNSIKKEDLVSISCKSSVELNDTVIENYCDVCDLKVNNKFNYDVHLKSKKHLKNVSQNNDTKKNSNDVNDAPPNEKAKLIIINHDKKQESDFKVKDNITTPTVVKLKDTNTPIVTSDVVPETKVENGLNCSECNKSFGTKSNLNLHMNIHKSVKPFSCLKCEKSFAQKNNLKIHEEKCDSQNMDVPIKTVDKSEKSKTKTKSELGSKSDPELLIKTKSVPQSKLNEVKTIPMDSFNINKGINTNTVNKVPISVRSINDNPKLTETSETKLAPQFHASVKPITQIQMKTSDHNLDASQNKSKLNTTVNQPQVYNAPKITKEINHDKISTIPTEKVSKHTLENSKFAKNVASTASTKKNGFLGNSKLSPISTGNIWGMNKETEWKNMNNVFQSFKADKVNDVTPILFKKVEVFEKKPAVTEKPFQMFGKNVPLISGSDIPQVFGPKVTPTTQNVKPLQQTEISKEIPLINFDDIPDKDDEEEVEFECKDCMEAFWFKYQLHSHFKEVHGVEDPEAYENRKRFKEIPHFLQKSHQNVQKQKPLIQAYVVPNSNNAMRFVCEVCNLTFNDKSSLTRHLQTKKHEDNKFLKNSQKNQKEQQNLNTNKVNPQQLPNVNINTSLNPQNMNTNTRVNLHETPIIQNKIIAPQQISASKRPLSLSSKEREKETPVRKIAKPNKSESFILVDDEDNDIICKYAGCMETFWYDQQLKDHVAKAHI